MSNAKSSLNFGNKLSGICRERPSSRPSGPKMRTQGEAVFRFFGGVRLILSMRFTKTEPSNHSGFFALLALTCRSPPPLVSGENEALFFVSLLLPGRTPPRNPPPDLPSLSSSLFVEPRRNTPCSPVAFAMPFRRERMLLGMYSPAARCRFGNWGLLRIALADRQHRDWLPVVVAFRSLLWVGPRSDRRRPQKSSFLPNRNCSTEIKALFFW